jgi:malonyl-CoA O-methyltransferase
MSKPGPDQRPGYKNISVVEGYDKWALSYDSDPNPLIAVEEKITLDLIGDINGKQVLDLGCGTGRYCVLLTNRGAEVTGIDPAPVMIEKAREKVNENLNFEIEQGLLEDSDFPNEHFDLIVSALTFGHIPDIEPVFREMKRILKNDGRIVVSDFHPYWPVFGHGYTEFYDGKGQEYRIKNFPHLFEEYFVLCKKYGFHIVDIREPVIDSKLVESFPSLKGFVDIPLALILKFVKIH